MDEQEATIRKSEQRVLEKSLEAKSLEAQVVDLEEDLASARASLTEAEVGRSVGAEQSATLAEIFAGERGCSSARGAQGRDGRS